jgi:hypothetical protein
MNSSYAIRDREGTIHPQTSKKDARSSQKAYGGMIVRSRDGGEYQPWKPHHVFLWVFLSIQAIFIIWLIFGAFGNAHSINPDVVAQCRQLVSAGVTRAQSMGMTQSQCVSFLGGAAKTGSALGAGLVVVLWVVVDFLVGLTYGIYRLVRR